MSDLILASRSPQRADLLRSIYSDFHILPADIDELAIDHQDQAVRAAQVAAAKADKVAATNPEAFIVAADTFVFFQSRRLEKPTTALEAEEMLRIMSGQRVQILTGVCWQHGSVVETDTVISYVTFRPLSSLQIQTYVTGRPVTTWAGGFSLKDVAGLSLVEHIEGSITSVLGLPLEWVEQHLIAAGLLTSGQ